MAPWLTAFASLLVAARALPLHRLDIGVLAGGAPTQQQVNEPPAEWPGQLLPSLADEPAGSFRLLLEPLIHAVTITYHSSSGPEFRQDVERDTIPGGSWERLFDTEVDVTDGGIHARTFVDRASRRAIVAFRGICMDDGFPQCRVDKCFLQSFRALGSVSPVAYHTLGDCAQHKGKFDYARQADDHVRRVQQALPGYRLLLTGHSLGGALAVVVAAARQGAADGERLQAVAFAPTAFHELLRGSGLGLSEARIAAIRPDELVAVGDPYDCLINSAFVPAAREGSTTCLLSALDEPECCDPHMKLNASFVVHSLAQSLQCKGLTHDWARYERVLMERAPGSDKPAHLPECSTKYSVFED